MEKNEIISLVRRISEKELTPWGWCELSDRQKWTGKAYSTTMTW